MFYLGVNVLKTGSGKKKMRRGLGLIALGVSIVILGSQASKHRDQNSDSTQASEAISYQSINKQELGADVVEFFWYGCPHCLRLERSLESQSFHDQVAKTTVAGQYKASFIRVPAALNDEWTLDARLFYALDSLGMTGEGHLEIMSIIQDQRPKSREQMISLLNAQIVPAISSRQLLVTVPTADAIELDMFSPNTDAKIQASIQMGRAINLTGVPVMVVSGDKVVSLGSDATYDTMGPKVLTLLNRQNQ